MSIGILVPVLIDGKKFYQCERFNIGNR